MWPDLVQLGSALVQLVVVIGSLDRLWFSVGSALAQIGMA